MKHPVLRNVSEESWTNTEQASNETYLLRKSIAQPCTALSSDYAARQKYQPKQSSEQARNQTFILCKSIAQARTALVSGDAARESIGRMVATELYAMRVLRVPPMTWHHSMTLEFLQKHTCPDILHFHG